MTECALVSAAQAGDYLKVLQQLEDGDGVEQNAGDGTALWWAACRGHAKIVNLLLDWGADVSVTRANYTVTAIAENQGHPEIATLLKAAVQQPRKAPIHEKWVTVGEDAVALAGLYPAISKKLTQIFNFATRERLIIVENLHSRTDTMTPPTSFDELPQQTLRKALEEFERLGGKADRDYVLKGGDSLGKEKIKLPREREKGEPT